MSVKEINVAKDFSRTPAGRFIKDDANNSGEALRTNHLVPALNNPAFDVVVVNIDGLPGVGSFFWEEAFGGLVRENRVDYNIIKKKLKLISNDNINIVPRIEDYIEDAYKKLRK